LDGTDYYSSTCIGCEHCLTSTHTREGKETTRHRHAVLSATLFKARWRQIPALDAEPIRNTDGAGKQDRELNAAKRLPARFRREHPKLPVLLLGDAIYPHEPLLGQVGQLAMRYLLVVKPGSQPETFEWVEDLEAKREWVEHGRWTEGPVAKRRFFEYRICRHVPVSQERLTWSTFLEVWEHDKTGAVIYHNSWVTDLEVTASNVEEVFWLGRGRWKIENEQFNTHKRGGYELEHNFGHGGKTLATVFYFLNLLAFVVHRMLDRSDALYQQCRARGPLKEVWTAFRVMIGLAVYESWAELVRHRLATLERGGP
jgi:hypothetical protein